MVTVTARADKKKQMKSRCNGAILFCQKFIVWYCSVFTLLALAQPTDPPLPPGEAVATAHPAATRAGMEILQAGGNAFDAAVAISAALAVAEPTGSGLGGGGFWLLHRAEDQWQVMVDGREQAPRAIRVADFLDAEGKRQAEVALNSALAAGIPGTVAAMVHLSENYGRLPWQVVLQPAIELARAGVPVGERYQKLAKYRQAVMLRHPQTRKIFLPQGKIPALGSRIIQQDLATVLERLAVHGGMDFYTGETAAQLLAGVSTVGGIWEKEDLAGYRVVERAPIVFRYNDLRIVTAPLPSAGGVALAQSLGILQQFDWQALSATEQMHVTIESLRRAFRDRAKYLGDPDFLPTSPLPSLLAPDYLQKLKGNIRLHQATPSEELTTATFADGDIFAYGVDTTHFSVLDREGNRVAATLSINLPFGSGIVVPGTGILLNNELDDFSLLEQENAYGLVGEQPNQMAAGKRPLSSMTPSFVEAADHVGILGTPGGSRIVSMVLLAILDIAAGKPVHSWVRVSRYHHQYLPDKVQYEQGGMTTAQQQALRSKGHRLEEKNRRYGNMQAILWQITEQQLDAASDPRGEGSAEVRLLSSPQR